MYNLHHSSRLFQPSLFSNLLRCILKADADQIRHILKKQPQLIPEKEPANNLNHTAIISAAKNHQEPNQQLLFATYVALLSQDYTYQRKADLNHEAINILRPLNLPQHVIEMVIEDPALLALIMFTPNSSDYEKRADVLHTLHDHRKTNLASKAVMLPDYLKENARQGFRVLDITNQYAMAS